VSLTPATLADLGRVDVDTETWPRGTHTDRVTNVADLDDRHRRNVLRYLRRNAVLVWANHRALLRTRHMRQQIDDPTFRQRLAHLDATPAPEWLEDTPLVRRLVQLSPPLPRPPRRRRLLPARLTGGRR
jgi:hypothetical protein